MSRHKYSSLALFAAIAVELGISEKTVQTHRTRIMEKMQNRSVASLAKMVLKEGP